MNPMQKIGLGNITQINVASPVVQVSFTEGLSTMVLCEKIRQLPEAQVVLWYIGPYGLKEQGVTFYKKEILEVLSAENRPTAWLYDLTAWGAFNNSNVTIDRSSSKVSQIMKLNQTNLRCIRSSDVFGKMQSFNSPYFVERLRQHTFLLHPSESFKDNDITIGKIFKDNCPVLKDFHQLDTSKAYSLVQYLETFFILEKIISERLEEKSDIEVVFALPNDEAKYYQDDAESFQIDLNQFVKDKFGDKIGPRKINVKFLCFIYGEEPSHRPYNAPGKSVRKISRLDQVK